MPYKDPNDPRKKASAIAKMNRYRKKHPERVNMYSKLYYLKNDDRIKAKNKRWYNINLEHVRARDRRYRAKVESRYKHCKTMHEERYGIFDMILSIISLKIL